MAGADIPTGKNTRESQADGAAETKPDETGKGPEPGQVFHAQASWRGGGAGAGAIRLPDAGMTIPIAGSRLPGEPAAGANPEELLLAAIAACFLNTWAIFLKKLQVDYPEPAIRVRGTLGKDPAGGYRMTGAVIHAQVPAALLAADRTRIEKTLQLAEKYCIISKVARAAISVQVEVEKV
ncbi:MAG TPA: OsmC family protein [Thermoanaerobaculia bacterium]|jgi:osmotically inducible protein OsmC